MPTTTKAKNEPAVAPKKGENQFSKETYLYWYESMQLMRKFEEKAGQLYGMQKIIQAVYISTEFQPEDILIQKK